MSGTCRTNGTWEDGARFGEPGQDLGHAAVGDKQLARDVTGPVAEQCQLEDAQSHMEREGLSIGEGAPELVHSATGCPRARCSECVVAFGRSQ